MPSHQEGINYTMILKKIFDLNRKNLYDYSFFYLCLTIYIFFEIVLTLLNDNFIINVTIIFYNICFMGYFYYFLRQNDFNSKSFLVFFFLIKYFQYTIGIQWPIAQFSLFFDTNSVLTNIGLIFHLNFNFLSFVLAFGFTFVDYAILVLFYKFVSFFSTKILDITSFEMLISNFSVQNFKKISKDFFGKPLTTKLKTTILLVLIVLAPIAYTDSMETIHETNNGIYYLTSGLNLIIGYFEKNSGFSGFFSKSNELLNVKNIIYFAGKDFQLY